MTRLDELSGLNRLIKNGGTEYIRPRKTCECGNALPEGALYYMFPGNIMACPECVSDYISNYVCKV